MKGYQALFPTIWIALALKAGMIPLHPSIVEEREYERISGLVFHHVDRTCLEGKPDILADGQVELLV
jgi:hypothetical protein